MRPATGKAIVTVEKAGTDDESLPSGLIVVHGDNTQSYQRHFDWELGTVEALGEGDWEPVTVGDRVFIQNPGGGAAGADIGGVVGESRGRVVVIDRDEIVAKLED